MAVGYQDYYEALEVPRNASTEEIRRAYRRLARKYHPDVNKEPGAEDRFKEISEAYEVLRDAEKRARYDRLGPNWKAGQDVSDSGGFGEEFRTGDGFNGVQFDFGGGDFSDFFEGMFGQRGSRRGARAGAGRGGFDGFSMRGGDQEAVLELTLEEAASGGRRRISLGDGRDFEVEIPRGVRDGQRIRLAGEGSTGAGGGPSGDLFLRIRVKPHPRFRVEGRDLYVDLPVAPWEAALGAEVPVHTLSGTARLKVPPGSSTGRRLRLRGQGLPSPDGSAGDLYAVLAVHVPKRLTKEERELFERLAAVSKFDPRKR
ncbi:MAG TPA: DnaJ C-terminal domain-containing protein [Solirubrobacteraceae bacterium]|jgi:curved DNA-binding protein|nr:DnaJ C-terminal domain-containing protein [Solirubrobacteraceae bacterium]